MPLTNYKVYIHTNKTNGKVYVGITRQTLKRRWQKGYGYEGSSYFKNAINKYGWDGFTHELLGDNLTKEQACNLEKQYIAAYKSNNREYGYNICEGGQTGDNLHPYYGASNVNASSVRRIDPKTGEIVNYETVAEASKSLGINHRGISKACRGIARTYKGYIWEYTNKDFKKPFRYSTGKYPHVTQRKKVKLIEPDGTEKIFASRAEASLYAGVNSTSIYRYISGQRKDASGRRWLECL